MTQARIGQSIVEDWVSFENDATRWNSLLLDLDCDTASRMSLFALAQNNKRAANGIIWKLVKKIADKQEINNASAFVHSSVKRTREDRWCGSEQLRVSE